MAVGLNTAVANTHLSKFSTSYVQVHTGDPGSAGTANVLGTIVRKAVTFGANTVVGTTVQRNNTALVRWDVADVTIGGTTATHVSFWDAVTAGNFVQSSTITTPQTITISQPFEMAIGALVVSIGPIAS